MSRTKDAPIVDADGRVLYAPNPSRLVDLVTPHPTAGGGLLYLGGSWRPYPRHTRYDLVVTVCGEFEGYPAPASQRHMLRPLRDNAHIDEWLVERAVKDVVETVEYGHSVLVRCYTGQNRSGLVVALAMTQLYDMDGADAIEHLRKLRSPNVLCNPAFEQYVEEIA